MSINRCLVSVYDKSGLLAFGRALAERGVELIASGGTARTLREGGVAVREVSDLTGSPEILGGRVKTLHPAIHGGILSRRTPADRDQLAELGWGEVDLVVVNLYPFEQTAGDPTARLDEVVEQIDIGGVALLRAGAKNFAHVAVVCDPGDYETILDQLQAHGDIQPKLRRELAVKAFERTAAYDAAIQRYLWGDTQPLLPDRLVLGLNKLSDLRYGENPHQRASLYLMPGVAGPLGGELLQGKALSYNNLLDLDAAWRAAIAFGRPTIAIVKHLSPCGLASANSLVAAFGPALAGDPVSAFGGVIAANRVFDGATARGLGDLFVEAIAAPDFSEEAREVLSARSGCRLIALRGPVEDQVELRSVRGGLLCQERDRGDEAEWQVVTQRAPSEREMAALRFAWQAVAHVKSNAILLAQGEAAVGIGGGLPSRVDAVRLAVAKAGERAPGAAMASDAFFPFPDGVEVAAEAGVTAVVEPGGSVRDEQVIEVADRLGLAMCFTGVRHFRHQRAFEGALKEYGLADVWGLDNQEGHMRYRNLGRTGLEVSEIGFGGWGIGGGWGGQDDTEALRALGTALDTGITFFDTALGYGDGHSEALIGRAVARMRDRVAIATKIPTKTGRWLVSPSEPVSGVFPADWVIQCTEDSLRNLNSDYIDVQQLHAWTPPYEHQLAWYDALTRLKEQGEVRAFGVQANDWDPCGPVGLVKSGLTDTAQVIYNIFEQRSAEQLLPAALEHDVGIIVRVPFEEGLLTGKLSPGYVFEEDDWRAEWLTAERLREAARRVEALEEFLAPDRLRYRPWR